MPNEKLQSDIERLARDFAAEVTRLVAAAIVSEVQAALARPAAPQGRARMAAPPRRVQATQVERWVPDRRARRVPKFVSEATGIATKHEIVERYGEHAIFQRGHPAPPPLRGAAGPRAAGDADG